MMHAVALKPFIGVIENHTTRAIESFERKKRRAAVFQERIAWVLCLSTVYDLFWLSRELPKLIVSLNSPDLDSATQDDLKKIAHVCTTLHQRVAKAVRNYDDFFGVARKFPYSQLLGSISETNCHLNSVVEGLRLSITDGFTDMMESIAQDVSDNRTRPERSASHCHNAK